VMKVELTKEWCMSMAKHEMLAGIVSAVPDIGDKAARELSIARTAYNAGCAEDARLRAALEIAYCQKIGADSPNGLAACDDFKDWLRGLGA
jgi:hypothetical protein